MQKCLYKRDFCVIILNVWDVRYVALYNTHVMQNGSA